MELNQLLQNVLVATLLAVLPIVTQALTRYLKSISNDKYIRHATDVVIAVVTAISQKLVDDLKKQGAFTKEKQKEVFELAKSEVLRLLNDKTKIVLKEFTGDVDKWVEMMIESTVKDNKQGA